MAVDKLRTGIVQSVTKTGRLVVRVKGKTVLAPTVTRKGHLRRHDKISLVEHTSNIRFVSLGRR